MCSSTQVGKAWHAACYIYSMVPNGALPPGTVGSLHTALDTMGMGQQASQVSEVTDSALEDAVRQTSDNLALLVDSD